MIRAVVHRTAAPPGTYSEWTNQLPGWLFIQLWDGALLSIGPGGCVQIPRADLAREPVVSAWLEGLELRGVLRQSVSNSHD